MDIHPGPSAAAGNAGTPKRKILHVLFSSRVAGSERYCADLANGQVELGHEVHVVGTQGSPIAGLLSKKVIFHGFATPFLRGMRLRRLMARKKIDFAHAHLSPGCKALSTCPESVVRVATLHVGFKQKQHGRLDGVICVNRAQLARLGDYAGKVALIANWLPDVHETPKLDLRARLDLPQQTKLVGAVGRLHPSKGNDVLVTAFRRAAPSNCALVIAGEGKQRAELQTLIGDDKRIHLLGHCDNVTGFLRDLDLFVSPSREESFGLAILEAMQQHLPVIATATDGPSEYLRNYPVVLIEPGSIDALSSALKQALREGDVAERPRVDYDLAPFSRQTGVANVLDFYTQVADRASASSPSDTAGTQLKHAV